MENKEAGKTSGRKQLRKPNLVRAAISIVAVSAPLLAQQHQNFYIGANATGQLNLSTTVNLLQQTGAVQNSQIVAQSIVSEAAELHATARIVPESLRFRREFVRSRVSLNSSLQAASSQSLTINSSASSFGFMGLTHYDQRNANG